MLQRLGSNDSSQMVNDQTVQALQGLTFGGSGDGIGIGLALLQARSQAATQAQVRSLHLAACNAGNDARRAACPQRDSAADAFNSEEAVRLGED